MGLRDMLKKKDRLDSGYAGGADADAVGRLSAGAPEFTFIRSDTVSHEVIYPPAHSDDAYLTAKDSSSDSRHQQQQTQTQPSSRRSNLDVFRPRSRGNSAASSSSSPGDDSTAAWAPHRRSRLRLSRSPKTSEFVPENLPTINLPGDGALDPDAAEREWENRATMLAQQAENRRSRSNTPLASPASEPLMPDFFGSAGADGNGNGGLRARSGSGVVSSKAIDDDIQEAIRLHEEGDLPRSTALFGRLADPNGAANPLSQVLYGLALRHGWGCEPDPERAVTYLSAAASNSAEIENMALKAGLKKGGAAKGELVLAIFELANCFRFAWGINKDPVAAKQYYETAANLGDTDAMNEVAWCYLEGFGCKKDKYASARYYRLAEQNGNKTLGNTWIWKEKYDPDKGKGGKKK